MPIWEEPPRGNAMPRHIWALDGLAQMHAYVDGHAPPPPIHHLTGMIPSAAAPGAVSFVMPASPWLQSPAGDVLGGVLAILADGPLGGSVQSTLPSGTVYTTTELSLSYLRPAAADGRTIAAHGTVVHAGRSLALSECRVVDAAERVLAHGTSRCFVFPPRPMPTDLPPLEPYVPPVHETPDPWQRPVTGAVTPAEVWAEKSGLEILGGWIEGSLPHPPIGHLMGHRPIEAADGTASFTMPASGWLASPTGNVEGGVLVMLADAAMAGAVQTTIPARTAFAPIDVTMKFIAAVPADGRLLRADARLLHRGRSMAVAVADVRDETGRLMCTAISSAMVLPGREMVGLRPIAPEDSGDVVS